MFEAMSCEGIVVCFGLLFHIAYRTYMCVFVGWLGSRVDHGEMEAVLFDSRSQVLTAGPVKMCVKQGDITKERADAIINSTNEQVDMTSGRLWFYFIVTD